MADELFKWGEEHGAQSRAAIAPPRKHPCAMAAGELPADFLLIVQVLDGRVGQERSVTALGIAERAGLWPTRTPGSRARSVRELLERHFSDLPWPICGDETGFYRPATAEELCHYHANLRGRGVKIFSRLATLKRIAPLAGFEYLGNGQWRRN